MVPSGDASKMQRTKPSGLEQRCSRESHLLTFHMHRRMRWCGLCFSLLPTALVPSFATRDEDLHLRTLLRTTSPFHFSSMHTPPFHFFSALPAVHVHHHHMHRRCKPFHFFSFFTSKMYHQRCCMHHHLTVPLSCGTHSTTHNGSTPLAKLHPRFPGTVALRWCGAGSTPFDFVNA